MRYDGIVITGTSCAGKTTVARKLCEKFDRFQIVRAITTRTQRADDLTYEYITDAEFDALELGNNLLVKASYRNEKYGITKAAYDCVLKNNKTPILIITPESAKNLEIEISSKLKHLIFFLDAQDDFLDKRLVQRKVIIGSAIQEQRGKDRLYCQYTKNNENLLENIHIVFNNDGVDIADITNLISYLWECRASGGIIPKKIIEIMIKCGMLLENAAPASIQGASYDLALGAEYYQNGAIKELNDATPFIIMEPGDYVLASSGEIANLPTDIAGRFDITVTLFCKGVILSNGPQIDPGFKGRLFCLLFNTSNEIVQLKYGDHFATIEFIKLIAHTIPYYDKYQGKFRLKDYIPYMAKGSAINKLIKDLEELKKEKWWIKILPIIIAALAIVISIFALIWVVIKSGVPSNP